MKKLLVAMFLICAAAPARAGIYYDLQQTASSATLRMVGVAKWWASSFSGTPSVVIDGVTGGIATTGTSTFTATGANYSVVTSSGVSVGGTGGVFATFFAASSKFIGNLIGNVTGNLTGNVTGNLTGVASQATIWDHTPTKCSVGNYPLGTDTGGNAANCTAAGIGDVTQAGANAFVGNNTHAGTEKFSSTNTVTNVVLTSTASYAALNINSEWTLISSTHPAGSGSFWFYNLVSTAPAGCTSRPVYKIDFALVAGAASGEYLVQFGAAGNSNVDTTTNYHGSMTGNANAGSLILNGWADAGCLLTYQNSTLGVRQGFPYQGTFVFSPMVGNDHFVYGRSDTYGNYGNDLSNRASVLMSACTWPSTTNIGPLSFMKFTTTNGVTMTGDVSLWFQCTQ